MEEKHTINFGNEPEDVLIKHMRRALEQLRSFRSEEDCKKWEESIKMIEELACVSKRKRRKKLNNLQLS